jgi:6-phosphogluconolactonase
MAIVRAPITAALLAGACFAQTDYLAYVGGYGPEIIAFRFHSANGRLTRIGPAADTPAPSFLVVHPNGHYLYAANEAGKNDDTVSAFAIDSKSGKLTLLNVVSARGSSPCHLSIDKTGRFLAVANYANGTVAVLPIMPDGRLGAAVGFDQQHGSSVNRSRQEGPHAHCVVFSSDNRFLLSADLGADKIFVYRFDAATGAIAANDPPSFAVTPGWGPRHIEFHPNGKWVYVLFELTSRLQLLHFDAAKGALEDGQTISMLPEKFTGTNTAAELALNLAGTLLYASNRGNDSIALFHIDPERGMLAQPEFTSTLGKTPRYFTFDPTGQYLLVTNQDSDDMAVFHVHPATGELQPSGPIVSKLEKPSCIVFIR